MYTTNVCEKIVQFQKELHYFFMPASIYGKGGGGHTGAACHRRENPGAFNKIMGRGAL